MHINNFNCRCSFTGYAIVIFNVNLSIGCHCNCQFSFKYRMPRRRRPANNQAALARNLRRRGPQLNENEQPPQRRRRNDQHVEVVQDLNMPNPVQPNLDNDIQVAAPVPQPIAMRDIWIIGSSIIKRASDHTENRPTGTNLGFDKKGYNIIWLGLSGMKWFNVDRTIDATFSWRGVPSILIIHCGGNDLVNCCNGELLFHMRSTFHYLKCTMPNTLIIWSFILPRLSWRGALNNDKIEKSRRRINRGVRSYISKIGCKTIKHLDFEDKHQALFAADGVHLSFLGNDIFINTIQTAIDLFIDNSSRTLYPDEL
ncbi:uncharacterized protein [Mytilus edulis]|uniref:uncharacterized protein n=1 Tax=Mytilus edulis TaxID=6550 RepID=UPI0039EE6E25